MKKRIFLIMAFMFTSVFILSNTGTKEVNAAENCQTYYNYYLLLDATPKSYLDSLLATSNPLVRTTSKNFELGVPEGAKNIKQGQLTITNSSIVNEFDDTEWSLAYFHWSFEDIGPDTVTFDNAGNGYSTAIQWYDENGNPMTTSTAIPVDYKEFGDYVPTDLAKPTFSNITLGEGKNGTTSISITRTWTPETISHISSDKTVWSPAVYYVKYDVCTGTPDEQEPEVKYNIDVEFVDVDTNERIVEDTAPVVSDVPSGTTYTYDCSNHKFDGYNLYTDNNKPSELAGIVTENKTLTCYYRKTEDNHSLIVEHLEEGTNDKIDIDYNSGEKYKKGNEYQYQCKDVQGYEVTTNPSLLEGTFEDKDITRQCYYKKRTYVLTINYGEDEECINLIKESDSVDLKYKETYTYDKIPKVIGKLSSPKLGLFSKNFNEDPKLEGTNLTVTMPAKNVDVCIVYTPQTGASWLYFVWVIGILSLGYSIWYFARYYKKQNNEI